MFTGIIDYVGRLKSKNGARFIFQATPRFCRQLKTGLSVAVNGACLTVIKTQWQSFTVDIMPETQKRAIFGRLREGDEVNLELPVKPQAFLSGHIAQGHVDGTGKIKSISLAGNSHLVTMTVQKQLSRYIVEKGSIAINGVSLTVIKAKRNYFTVGIIPYTWRHTNFHKLKVGQLVNIEVDILAKYLEKLIQ